MSDSFKMTDEVENNDEPKWRREPEKRPNDILDGALKEFRAKGFKGARIEDIAKHAGLSKGTVYLYFSSKEDMLKALVRRTVVPIAENLKVLATRLSGEAEKKSASEILKAMVGFIGGRLSQQKVHSLPLLIISESGNFPEIAQFYRDEVVSKAMGALATVIERGVEEGEFKAVNPHLAIRSLMGAFIMQVIWNGVFARDDDPELPMMDLVNTHFDIFLNGICVPKEAS